MEERVKPVVIDDEHVEVVKPRDQRGLRIRPGILALVVLGIFGVSAAMLAIARPTSTPEPEPTALTDFTPRTPREHLDASDPLVLVTTREEAAWSITWDPVMNPAPDTGGTIGLIPYVPDPEYRTRRFDASATYATNEECDESGCAIRLSSLIDRGGTVASVDGTAPTWHATSPGRFVWTAAGSAPVAWTAILEDDGRLYEVAAVFELEDGERAVRYDEYGFVTRATDFRIRDLTGTVLWSTEDRLVDVTPQIVVTTSELSWYILNRADGSVIAELEQGNVRMDARYLETARTRIEDGVELITIDVPVTGANGTPSMIELGFEPSNGVLRIYRDDRGERITFEYTASTEESDT